MQDCAERGWEVNRYQQVLHLSDLDPLDAIELLASMAPDMFQAVTASPSAEQKLLDLASEIDRLLGDDTPPDGGGDR